MTYDLELLRDSASNCGFAVTALTDSSLDVEIASGVIFTFVNYDDPNESLFGFKETGWHLHGESVVFNDNNGRVLEIEYIYILSELKAGNVLVCDGYCENGELSQRSLVHRQYSDELRFLQPGEAIRFWQCA